MMETNEKSNSYLSFSLGNETYASHVKNVLNILEMTQITKVPQAPDYMLGVINLRGTVLPIIDTRIKIGLNPTTVTKDTCIVVLEINMENEKLYVGSLVDSVSEVLEIFENEILSPPNIGNKFKSQFITGMFKKEEGFIMIVNMNNIFSEQELDELVSISA